MELDWPATSVSLVAVALAVPTGVAAVLSPTLTRRCGVQGVISAGLVAQTLCAAVLCARLLERDPQARVCYLVFGKKAQRISHCWKRQLQAKERRSMGHEAQSL